MKERLGWLPPGIPSTRPGGIWLHAVSVGEVLSVVTLLKSLRQSLPDTPLFVSTATLAGRSLAGTRLAGLCDGVFFAPIDYPFAIRRVLRRIAPALIVNLETEIWPNLLREAKRSGAKWAQVNSRISDRAWPKYQRLAWLFQSILPQIDFLAAQSAADAVRFRSLGFDKDIALLGNLKFDVDPHAQAPPADILDWLQRQVPKPLWIAASTTLAGGIDEDDGVLDAFAGLDARLVLAPRKPERFEIVAAKLTARGVPFTRRTTLDRDADVLLLDSIGELASLFALADVVLVGGSFNTTEGHNILEPACFAKPVLTGPRMGNFAAIQQAFLAAEAVQVVQDISGLKDAVQSAILTGVAMGKRGAQVAARLRGVATRLTPVLVDLLSAAVPQRQGPLFAARSLFTGPWSLAARRKQRVQRLPMPVVSVGNLTMGGTGKTPIVLALAAHFHAQGKRVGILTRGYGRVSGNPLILAPSQQAAVAETGDEAQLYIAAGNYTVGIGADRYAVGQQLVGAVDLILLDDGFQHRRLHRDFDLLVVDALNPLAGGDVPPAGWLREPVSAASRADAIVLTRARPGNAYRGLAALFAQPLHQAGAMEQFDLPPAPGRRIAFCGIGNPSGFRQSLDRAGLAEVELIIFADHHQYTAGDIDRLHQRGDVWITTAKDAIKFTAGAPICVLRQHLILNPQLLQAINAKVRRLFR